MASPADEVKAWPPELREEWEERAAIIEDGCRVTREEAEHMALEQLRPRAPLRQASLFERALMKAQGG